jgi:hypothetical protein
MNISHRGTETQRKEKPFYFFLYVSVLLWLF